MYVLYISQKKEYINNLNESLVRYFINFIIIWIFRLVIIENRLVDKINEYVITTEEDEAER